MEDVGLWQAYEAQALMYNAPNNQASVADPACVPQSPFLPCWNESWLRTARPQEIHDVSTLVCTPSPVVDTVSFEQRHQPMIQLIQASSELQNVVRGSDGLWGPHSSSPASELYSSGDSELQKLTQVGHFSNNMPGPTSMASNSFQSGYDLLHVAGKVMGTVYADSMRDKLLIQASAAGAGAMTRSSSQFNRPVPQMLAIGSARDSCLEELLHPQQHPQKLQLPVVPERIGAIDPRGATTTGLGLSPRDNSAATTNAQEIPRQTVVAAAPGMKSMASFNPGPYVSINAAVDERQDHGVLAVRKTWFENKGNNTAASMSFDLSPQQQLGGSAQRIVGSQQQMVRPESSGNEWPSRMSSIPAPLRVPSGRIWLKPVDENTSIVMQPEAGTTVKCALPRCPPPAAASGNTAFINSRKRSILQGDSFEGSSQNTGKKPVARGGMSWLDQDGCSRLEFLSTAAHKQVSQSTASGSRALGPALNTNLKPRARQGSANDPQSIAARVRRERISERLKYLQALIPNGDKVDMVTMLEKAINYVQCLELQIRMLKDDSVWPKALGTLPHSFHELLELAGPEFAGAGGQSKADVVESKPKISIVLIGEDPENPPTSYSVH